MMECVDPETGEVYMPTCGHCHQPMRGYGRKGDMWLCHPDEGLDCYRLVTVYGHETPCFPCASVHYDESEPSRDHTDLYEELNPDVVARIAAELQPKPRPWSEVREAMFESMNAPRRVWEKALARARGRYRSEIRKYRGIARIRAMYRRRKR